MQCSFKKKENEVRWGFGAEDVEMGIRKALRKSIAREETADGV